MKKLLTVSLVAVMAVSAAHAEIASTNYVGKQIAAFNTETIVPLDAKVGNAQFANGVAASHKGNVTDAIDAVAGVVAGLSGDGDGSVAKQIAAAKEELEGYADEAAGKALDDAKADAAKYIDEDELTASQEAQDAVLKAYTDTAAKADAEGALASGFVKTYVDKSVATIQGNLGDQSTTISQIATFDKDGNLTGGALGAVATTLDTAVELDDAGNLTGGATKAYTDDEIQKLDGKTVAGTADGSYVVQTTEESGIVTVSRVAFDKSVTSAGTDNTAPTTKAVYAAIEGAKSANTDAINDLDANKAVTGNNFVTGVTQVDGVITAISEKSINDAVVALATVPEKCGANGTNKCSLSVSKGTFTWEIIEE